MLLKQAVLKLVCSELYTKSYNLWFEGRSFALRLGVSNETNEHTAICIWCPWEHSPWRAQYYSREWISTDIALDIRINICRQVYKLIKDCLSKEVELDVSGLINSGNRYDNTYYFLLMSYLTRAEMLSIINYE